MSRSFLLSSQSMSGGLSGISLQLLQDGRVYDHRYVLVVIDSARDMALADIRAGLEAQGFTGEAPEAKAHRDAAFAGEAPGQAHLDAPRPGFVTGLLLGLVVGAFALGSVLVLLADHASP